ncbi:MAG TPA: UvrD-helicase domain-containing protein [Pseudonocardia sp.]|jgi:hypothetical protein|nr:UvrD-helicase domain-containing protein [Pseudonocardia sp.]
MPQLAVGVDFLSEFAHLEGTVRKRTIEALTKFHSHTHAGLHLEKLNNVRDDRVRTIRITKFWRGVVLAPDKGDRYILLRVMPHDDAIDWARKHLFTVNEVSGVLEVRDVAELERLTDVQTTESPQAPSRLFERIGDGVFRKLGIDEQVLAFARSLADEAAFDAALPFLPENQGEVLYGLASGMSVDEVWADIVAPRIPTAVIDTDDVVAAAERTQGRIALVDGPDDLLALLAKPIALWRVFLHPSQEKVAYRPSYWGSAQVTGGPGTGKTVVALHRVKHLIANRKLNANSVLVTTFTRGLADALDRDLAQLLDPVQRKSVQVMNVDRWAYGVVRAEHGSVTIAKPDEIRERWQQAASDCGTPFPPAFLDDEWRHVVLAHGVSDLAGYLSAPRRGRGRRLGKVQKQVVWSAIERFVAGLNADNSWTWLTIVNEATRLVRARPEPPFQHIVVDEIQDLHPAQWRLLRAAAPLGPDDLFLTGDPHQRIYGNHVSLRQVGVNVGGRSTRLLINYRTTAEILHWSLGVLGKEDIADLNDGTDTLDGYHSSLHGEAPTIAGASSPKEEAEHLIAAVQKWHRAGVAWNDMAVVARTNVLAKQFQRSLKRASIEAADLQDHTAGLDAVRVGTMHGMKGLEFRCVAVVAAGREQLPLPQAITPESEDPVRHTLEVQQERCLLFVACTRARERLRVSYSGERSDLIPVMQTAS